MADLLLETKLLVPMPRREFVARPRLVDVIDRASHGRGACSSREPRRKAGDRLGVTGRA